MNASACSPKLARRLIATAITSVLLVACAGTPKQPEGSAEVRAKLMQLQSDPQLASRAPVAIQEAEAAVTAAEKPQKDKAQEQHLVLLADRKVDIAAARAKARLLEDQRKSLSQQRESARLESRTAEADSAHRDTAAAQQETAELRRQIGEMNARETERGLVVTLGDVLFATGSAQLRSGATGNLAKLAAFLNKYQDRNVAIEGHTDSVGSEDSNASLSQRRAEAVKSFLVSQGVNPDRIYASGKGEGAPVASNDSASGRQQNRRVEVIIQNASVSSR